MPECTIKSARRVSDVSLKEAAEVTGLSYVTYRDREEDAGELRLSEIRALSDVLSPLGKELLARTVQQYLPVLQEYGCESSAC